MATVSLWYLLTSHTGCTIKQSWQVIFLLKLEHQRVPRLMVEQTGSQVEFSQDMNLGVSFCHREEMAA